MKGHFGPLVNDAKLVAGIHPSLRALLGASKVIDQFPAVMGSEDFQEASEGLSMAYVFIMIGVKVNTIAVLSVSANDPKTERSKSS